MSRAKARKCCPALNYFLCVSDLTRCAILCVPMLRRDALALLATAAAVPLPAARLEPQHNAETHSAARLKAVRAHYFPNWTAQDWQALGGPCSSSAVTYPC